MEGTFSLFSDWKTRRKSGSVVLGEMDQPAKLVRMKMDCYADRRGRGRWRRARADRHMGWSAIAAALIFSLSASPARATVVWDAPARQAPVIIPKHERLAGGVSGEFRVLEHDSLLRIDFAVVGSPSKRWDFRRLMLDPLRQEEGETADDGLLNDLAVIRTGERLPPIDDLVIGSSFLFDPVEPRGLTLRGLGKVVPEPTVLLLMLLGIPALMSRRFRHRRDAW